MQVASEVKADASKPEAVVPLPIILSVVAIVISLGTLARTYYHKPLGEGMSRYDMTTPKAAIESQLRMVADSDLLAVLEMNLLGDDDLAAEKLRTLEVAKESEWRGSKVLFVRFEQNGIKKYDAEYLSKDAKTGIWRANSSLTYSLISAAMSDSPEDKAISNMVSTWREHGHFE